jgi:hypothetical protein
MQCEPVFSAGGGAQLGAYSHGRRARSHARSTARRYYRRGCVQSEGCAMWFVATHGIILFAMSMPLGMTTYVSQGCI